MLSDSLWSEASSYENIRGVSISLPTDSSDDGLLAGESSGCFPPTKLAVQDICFMPDGRAMSVLGAGWQRWTDVEGFAQRLTSPLESNVA